MKKKNCQMNLGGSLSATDSSNQFGMIARYKWDGYVVGVVAVKIRNEDHANKCYSG